jgi:hypothetical protein
VARAVANVLEYPTRDLTLDGPAVPWSLALRPLALGLLGLGAALWLRRRPTIVAGIGRGLRFALHFAEMSLAMVAGMGVFHLLAGMPGHGSAEPTSLSYEVGMMVFMTVPMVAWMRFRGHSMRHGIEMAAGMLAPVMVIDALLLVGVGATMPWLASTSGPAMLLGMVAAMLLRPGHYLGSHVSAPAQPREGGLPVASQA